MYNDALFQKVFGKDFIIKIVYCLFVKDKIVF